MATLAQILNRNLRATRVKPRQAPLVRQAINEAVVRYGGGFADLGQLKRETNQTYRQQAGQAESAAQLISALANETQRQQNQNTNPLVARLAAYDNAPANSSSAVVAQNLGLTHAATDALLGTTARNAPIQAMQQQMQYESQRQSDLDKIGSKRSQLLEQVGGYISGRTGDLMGEDRKLRHDTNKQRRDLEVEVRKANQTARTQRRSQNLQHQDRQDAIEQRREQANKPKPGSGGKAAAGFEEKYGVKPATGVQLTAAKNKIGYALSVAKTHKAQKDPRGIAAEILVNGQPTFKDPTSGQPIPGIKAVDPLWASIGLDVAYDGHISNKNAAALHRLGYSVKALGLPTRPRRTAAARAPH